MRVFERRSAVCFGVAAALAIASSAAATDIVSFRAAGPSQVTSGDVVEVSVHFDFSDLTLGGGFDIVLTPEAFAFRSFRFADDLDDDPAFRSSPPDDASGSLLIAFGSFSGLIGAKELGVLHLVARSDLTFGDGASLLSAVDDPFPAGAFVDVQGRALAVRYEGLAGRFAVPEAGTALLVGIGAAALAASRRP